MTVKGLSRLQRKVNRMNRKLKRGPKTVAARELTTVGSQARLNLVESDSIATGNLVGSFLVRATQERPNVHQVTLINVARYAAYVEYGTGDLGVPTPSGESFGESSATPRLVSKIFAWSIVKGIQPQHLSRDEFSFRVAQRIAGETEKPSGHAPVYYMTDAWRLRKRTLQRKVRQTVKRALR